MTIYSGSETQGQDGVIEASLTSAETPAYRGTALHVIGPDFQLENFGRRIPSFQYEVFAGGTSQAFRKVLGLTSGMLASGLEDTGGISHAAGVYYSGVFSSGNLIQTRMTDAGVIIDEKTIAAAASSGSSVEGLTADSGVYAYNSGRYAFVSWNTSPQYSAFFKDQVVIGTANAQGETGLSTTVTSSSQFAVGDNYFYLIYDALEFSPQLVMIAAYTKDGAPVSVWQYLIDDLGFTSAANTSIRYDPVDKILYAINYTGTTINVNSFDPDTAAQLLAWTGLPNNGPRGGDIRGGVFWYGDLDPAASPSYQRTYLIRLNDDQTWDTIESHDGQTAVDSGVETGTIGQQARWVSDTIVMNGDAIWGHSQTDSTAATLQSVVEDLCSRAGMAATDYDVSGLAGTNIDGYAVKGVSSLRERITPLMQAYRFEPYEDDYKLKFAFKDVNPILIVTEDDMRPHEYGTEGGEFIQIELVEESKLPRRINVNYANINADYEPDMQFRSREATDSKHIAEITFEMAFTPTFAIRLADELLREAWVSRRNYSFSLPKKYAYLAPTNIIALNTDDYYAIVRLLEVGTGVDGRIQCKAVQAEDGLGATLQYVCTALDDAIQAASGVSYHWPLDDPAIGGVPGSQTVDNVLRALKGTSTYAGSFEGMQYPAYYLNYPDRCVTRYSATPAVGRAAGAFGTGDFGQVGVHTDFFWSAAGKFTSTAGGLRIIQIRMTGAINYDFYVDKKNGGSFSVNHMTSTYSQQYSTYNDNVTVAEGDTLSFNGDADGIDVYVNFVFVTRFVYASAIPLDAHSITFVHFGLQNDSKWQDMLWGRKLTPAEISALRLGWLRNSQDYIPTSTVYSSDVTTEEPIPGKQITILPDATVFFEIIDTNLLTAANTDLPIYVAGTSTNFHGYRMQKSLDSGASWADIGVFQENEATIGVAQNALGARHAHLVGRFDDADSLSVKFITQAPTLASVTDLQALNGSNAFAVGAIGRWEIISAATITQVDAQTFTLSRLLRGLKGTGAHIGAMQLYDSVVLLDTSSVGVLQFLSDDIGTTILLRAVYGAGFPDSDNNVPLTITGNPYKEYSPGQIMGYWQSSGDIELSWNRRARKNGAWRNGVDVPLDALSNPEDYTIKIYDNTTSPETLVRTVSSNSTNSYTYTAANIVTDFGSPIPVSGQVRVEVYQVDTIVGASRYGEKVI